MKKLSLKRRNFATAFLLLLTSQIALANSVSVITPSLQSQQDVLRLTGTVEASQNAALASLESGSVASIHAEVGDLVKQGQLLVTLNDTLAKLKLEELEAQLSAASVATQEAKRRYEEVTALSQRQVVAQTLLAERKAQHAEAAAQEKRQRASVAVQKEIVARHHLLAPFSGIIATRTVDVGEWVTQQSHLFQLTSTDAWRLSVEVPQEYFTILKSDAPIRVQVSPDVAGVAGFESKLERLVGVSNSISRTLTAHVNVPADSGLVVGMSASAEIHLPNTGSVIGWLPRTALKLHPDGGYSVFKITNNVAQRVLVELVEQQANRVAITNLEPDGQYVISGVELLKDGDWVNVVEERQ